MKNRIQAQVCLFALIVMLGVTSQSLAGQKTKQATGKVTADAPYSWYDGARKRSIWLNPNLVAEFEPKSLDHTQSKTLSASAVPIKTGQPSVRLWRTDSAITGKSASQIASQLPSGKYSPVLHDGNAESSRKRALPGNIIVHLKPDWTTQQRNNWLSKHSLTIIKQLDIGPNIFLIKTGPGLAALEKANEIYLSGEVIAAYPDWWIEVQKK